MSDAAYKPRSGTAGAAFWDNWCATCERDAVMNGTMDFSEAERSGKLCQIVADTMVYDVDDARYPKEWVMRNGTPTCTAYTEHVSPGELSSAERAAQTSICFGEQTGTGKLAP